MSETADRLRELAETVEFVEDEQGKEIRDIDVAFVRKSVGRFSALVATIGGVEPDRVPVFDLEIAPGDVDVDEDESAAEAAGEGEL